MKWLLKVLLPTVVGYFAMFIPLKIEEWVHLKFVGEYEDMNPIIYDYFGLMLNAILMIAVMMVVQATLVLPLWNKFKQTKNVFGLRGFYFMTLVCIACGFLLGYLLWETKFGGSDLLKGSAFMILVWIAYWTANLLTLKYVEQKTILKQMSSP